MAQEFIQHNIPSPVKEHIHSNGIQRGAYLQKLPLGTVIVIHYIFNKTYTERQELKDECTTEWEF